jgi:hypothetical protein
MASLKIVMQSAVTTLMQKFPSSITVVTENDLNTLFEEQDLTLISLKKLVIDTDTTWLDEVSSVLIMKS